MNTLWIVLMVSSVIAALITGRLEALTTALFDAAKSAVEVSLYLLGIVSLWLGFAKIMEDAGLVKKMAHLMRPLIVRLFKGIPEDHPSITSITLNMFANLLGLGNAATPFGIKAMQELQELNPHKDTVSFQMMLFIVLNTASVQLVPFTVIGLLSAYGAAQPSAVMAPIMIATVLSAGIAVGLLFVFKRIFKD